MDIKEKRKAEGEMTKKEREIYISIQKENEFMKIVLTLAKGETNPDRLQRMLYNLQIGNRRDYNKDLRGFIKNEGDLKTSHKEAFEELLDENDKVYVEVQKVICEKLSITQEEINEAKKRKEKNPNVGLEDPRGLVSDENIDREQLVASLLGRKVNQMDTKNSYEDFHIKQVKLNLKLSLTNIKNALNIIEENLTHIDISTMQPGSQDAKALASLVRRSKDQSRGWTEYLISEKMKKKFRLHEDSLLNLFNDTIGPAKRTWELATNMEKEMIDAGLVQEGEIEDLAKRNLSFNAKRYWRDEEVRKSTIENEVEPEDIEAMYDTNSAYCEDEQTFLNYKYFSDVSRTEDDIEKAEQGLGIDFKVSAREIATTNVMRRVLSIYYKIPENLRDTIENATKSFGLRGNNLFAAGFGYAMGQAAKDPDTIFGGHSEETARERHRRFAEGMGGSEGPIPGHGGPHEHNHGHDHEHGDNCGHNHEASSEGREL